MSSAVGWGARPFGRNARSVLLTVLCLVSLAACGAPQAPPGPAAPAAPAAAAPAPAAAAQPASIDPLPDASGGSALQAAEIYPAKAPPVAAPRPATVTSPASVNVAEGGEVTLNFVNAPIREFVDSVLANTLVASYTIDPRVQGTVTLRTVRPLPRSMVLGVVEDALAMNGAALIQANGAYKVVPLEDAVSAPAILQQGSAPVGLEQGFALSVIPLRYASAASLHDVLEPFVPSGRSLRVDPVRNLIIFAGTGPEAADFADVVSIFDVDWMAQKSFGLFPLKYADPKTMSTELARIFGQGGESGAPGGMVDFVPIDRLNAVLVITPQRSYLNNARTWIERLDRGNETDRRRLFVYYVQNGRAAELASVIGQAFAVNVSTGAEGQGAELAPGLAPADLSRGPTFVPQQTIGQGPGATGNSGFGTGSAFGGNGAYAGGMGNGTLSAARRQVPYDAALAGPAGAGPPGLEGAAAPDSLRIVADPRNNALLIYATPAEYETILSALKKLDIVPLQVLIEATIAEVTLNDALKYGLEYFMNFGGSTVVFNSAADGVTPRPTPGDLVSQFPGFSYLLSLKNVKLVINALSQITDVKVISSPQLMVLDNQPARLQVGDQVPLAVRTSVSTDSTSSSAPIVAEIEYRDTGVILDIIPRVNSSGLVVLDIVQEVSDVSPTVVTANTTTTTQATTPTISQRRIASTVAINSGDTVALGGLIRESTNRSVSGIPLLSEIPVMGNLFKTTSDAAQRTELLVLLTPRVVRDRQDAREVTDQLRQRLRGLAPLSGKIQ
jgi:general secretion pathway protein D